MIKQSLKLCFCLLISSFIAISCDVLSQQTNGQETNKRISVEIGNSGRNLPLKAGIPASALDITKDNVSRYLSSNFRSQITNTTPISMEEMQKLYEDALKNILCQVLIICRI